MAEEVFQVLPYLVEYLLKLPEEVLSGDVFAVSIVLMAFYLLVYIVNQLTGLIIFLLKKLVLLFIVLLAFFKFAIDLLNKIAVEGLTQNNIMFGVIGFFAGMIALMIAVYAAIASLMNMRIGDEEKQEEEEPEPKSLLEEIEPSHKQSPAPEKPQQPDMLTQLFSMQSLKDDRTMGAVLAYLVVAQFGVFSSKTIAAPNEVVGLGFFLVFMIAAVFFVYQSYKDPGKGFRHFAVACGVGLVLSVLLGHFWGNYSLTQLLSLGYFASDSLVAFVTGIALSLFMGSKG